MVSNLGRRKFHPLIQLKISRMSGYSGGQQSNRSGETLETGCSQRKTPPGKIGDTSLMVGPHSRPFRGVWGG